MCKQVGGRAGREAGRAGEGRGAGAREQGAERQASRQSGGRAGGRAGRLWLNLAARDSATARTAGYPGILLRSPPSLHPGIGGAAAGGVHEADQRGWKWSEEEPATERRRAKDEGVKSKSGGG